MEYCIMYRLEDLNGDMIDDYETLKQAIEKAKNCQRKNFQIREIYVFDNEEIETEEGDIVFKTN